MDVLDYLMHVLEAFLELVHLLTEQTALLLLLHAGFDLSFELGSRFLNLFLQDLLSALSLCLGSTLGFASLLELLPDLLFNSLSLRFTFPWRLKRSTSPSDCCCLSVRVLSKLS